MNIDDYFKKTTANMPKPRGKKTEGSGETHTNQEISGKDANISSGLTAVTSDANTIIHALTAVIDSKLAGVTEQIEKLEASVTQTMDKKITDVTQMIETRLASVLEAVADRGTEIQALTARMDTANEQMEAIDQTAAASEAKILTLEKQIKQLKERTDQLENHSRRCNVRILGITEHEEGTNAVKYLERWILEYLHLDTADGRKAQLRELKVEYALLYPDILRVNTDGGGYRLFSTPGEATVYVHTLELVRENA